MTVSHSDYTGTWRIDIVGQAPYLVLQDDERGRLTFTLAEASGGGVLLDGRPYSRRPI